MKHTNLFLKKYSYKHLLVNLLFFILLLSLCVHSFTADKPENDRPVLIIAHRGVQKFAPQNTIPAIEKAIEMGLDYVEVDVRETKDGEMILMHNSDVDATTDGTGEVKDLTLDEIKKLDAGADYKKWRDDSGENEFKGTKVPTFKEALQVMKGKIKGYIDFKAGATEKLVKILEETEMDEDVVVYCGIDRALEIQKLNKNIKPMPEVDNIEQLNFLKKAIKDIKVIETSIGAIKKEFIDELHKNGMMVFMDVLGLADNEIGMKEALQMGVDGIQTDNPDILLKVLKKIKEKK